MVKERGESGEEEAEHEKLKGEVEGKSAKGTGRRDGWAGKVSAKLASSLQD